MLKSAFIPITPFKIEDSEYRKTRHGRIREEANEFLSGATGAVLGGSLGAGFGMGTGAIMERHTPNKLIVPARMFAHMGDKSKMNPISKYVRGYRKYVGRTPKTVPYSAYAPVVLGIYGALGGLMAAEYKAKRKMDIQSGEEPITKKRYMKEEVIPGAAGAAAGILAADTASAIKNALIKKKLTGAAKYISYMPTLAVGAGAGMAAERIMGNIARKKRTKKEMTKTSERKETKMIIEKIASKAIELGYMAEMEEMEKDAIGAIPGAIVGAIRADQLSKDEANEVRDAYGLYPKGGVRNRGAWKGALGGWLGSIPGQAVTGVGISGLRVGGGASAAGVTALGLLTSLAGGAVGTKLLTDKYSRTGLNKIRQHKRDKY